MQIQNFINFLIIIGIVIGCSTISKKAQAHADFWEQEIKSEIPVLFKKTLDQYPELKGTLEPDIESIQLSESLNSS